MPQNKVDPLSNPDTCLRDAILMQSLGLNTIRVYNLDPAIDHSGCASIFNAAGIYMIIDVNSPLPNESLNAGDPGSSYSSVYLTRIFSVVEAFKDFPNLLGFFGGNEVINDDPTGETDPPFVRAVIRDLKTYISKHSTRTIPVGYSAAQVQDILQNQWNYFQCSLGNDDDLSRADFFGLNSYSWCGSSATFESSGYNVLTEWFAKTTIPIFFSEYGCNQIPQGTSRPFDEVQALYGEPMRGVFSGGLVFEWTEEPNDFGLVQVNSDKSLTLRQDFVNLQGQLNKLDISAVTAQNGTATALTPPTCAKALITGSFNNSFTLPTVPPGGQDLINNGVSSGVATGSMVQVTSTALPVPIKGTDGNQVSGLSLKVLSDDSSNEPGGNTAGGQGNGSSGSSGQLGASSSGVAAPMATGFVGKGLGMGVVAGGVLVGAVLL